MLSGSKLLDVMTVTNEIVVITYLDLHKLENNTYCYQSSMVHIDNFCDMRNVTKLSHLSRLNLVIKH